MEQVLAMIAKMQEYDAKDSDILIILALGTTFRSPWVQESLQLLDGWKEKGMGRDLRWVWMGEIWPVTLPTKA